MFRSILVAVDGSGACRSALAEAVDLARSEGSRLTLISVAEVPRWRFSGFPLAVPYPDEAELARQAERIVERAEALVPEGIPVSTVVRRGSAVKEILKRVEAGEHDLVVLGSRGLGPAGSLILGSVSRAVVARSPVPVLVARADGSRVDDTDAVAAA
jgi:nucleotide-binding universal stress UspA family protein